MILPAGSDPPNMILLLTSLASATEQHGVAGTSASLTMPAPQTCIEGLFANDPEFAVFDGLSFEQISDSMNDFIPSLFQCVPEGSSLSGLAELQVAVGCDGRVSSVVVESAENLSGDLLSCVTETMRYASFPAHDTPGGVRFLYPMQFRF